MRRTYTGDVADQSRGDLRLAAEVGLYVFTARDVPSFAHERALQTMTIMETR